jgi:hypothetical protein
MLFSQYFGGGHENGSITVLDGGKHRQKGYYRFAAANIALY